MYDITKFFCYKLGVLDMEGLFSPEECTVLQAEQEHKKCKALLGVQA